MTLDVPIPKRLEKRPFDSRGYLIPYATFVDKEGKPDFHLVDFIKVKRCIDWKCCGICGQDLEKVVALIGGEESIASKIFPDPPMHEECARYAIAVCPFLNNSKMKRIPAKEHEGMVQIANPAAGKERPAKMGLVFCRKFEGILAKDAANLDAPPALNVKIVGNILRIEWF